MASDTAKKVAGTYVADSLWSLPTVRAWLTRECREGVLAPSIQNFCASQCEILDGASVIVEAVTDDRLLCCIPAKTYDHESPHTFLCEVRFRLDPQTGVCLRD